MESNEDKTNYYNEYIEADRKVRRLAQEAQLQLEHGYRYGTLTRYKAWLVANGSTQVEGIDVDETFSPVVKPGTIQTVLSLAISRYWHVHQLDVKNAFLHGDLSETIYMHQPPGFRDSTHPDYEFSMTDLGSLNYFMGHLLHEIFSRMFLSQRKYAMEILERAHMLHCNPSRTLVDTESKLSDDGAPQVCLYMHDPREPHFLALKRVLWYVRGTLDPGLQLFSSFTTSLVAYSDVDWDGCPTTRRSTSEYCVFLGNNLLAWPSKRQSTLSRSKSDSASAYEAYRDDIHFVRDWLCWVRLGFFMFFMLSAAVIFIKRLPSPLLKEFSYILCVRCPLVSLREVFSLGY
ncbi:ribonuclease H-like domain-containing protein [Tanacetum coccineum]|uniref:Ribonuclease H-like domain-containing protein n=1 Tax=Tanacetum coccineum TaxID=301880 RepID=A0ABQ4YG55_9ASTR